jgi:hypothetical protein
MEDVNQNLFVWIRTYLVVLSSQYVPTVSEVLKRTGSAEATRLANTWISAIISNPEKDLQVRTVHQ